MKVVSRPIDAIVVFKGRGKPLPYKFKYVEDNGERREITVGRIIFVEEKQIGGKRSFIYDCQSCLDDVDRRYQLKFWVQDCSWELYKI